METTKKKQEIKKIRRHKEISPEYLCKAVKVPFKGATVYLPKLALFNIKKLNQYGKVTITLNIEQADKNAGVSIRGIATGHDVWEILTHRTLLHPPQLSTNFYWQKEKKYQFTASLSVPIPLDIQCSIPKWLNEYEAVAIAQEMTSELWLENVKEIPKVDPLIIGYKKGKFYILAEYDQTTYENYLSQEFAL